MAVRFWRGVRKQEIHRATDGQKDAATQRYTMQQYAKAVRQHKGPALVVLAGFSCTALCFGTALPYMLAHAIDLVGMRQPLVWGGSLLSTLIIAAITVLVGTLSNAIGLRGFARLDSPTQNYLRSTVMHRLLYESAAFYANAMGGSLTGNVIAFTNGYATVQDVFQRSINLVLPLVAGIFVIAVQSPLLAAMFLVMVVAIAFKTLRDSRSRSAYRRARKDAGNRLNGFVGDVISNHAAVQIFAGEAYEKRSLERVQDVWRQAAQRNISLFGRHYVQLVGSINTLQVVGIGLAAWLAVSGRISLGLVVFAISYLQRLSGALVELGPMVQTYQGALMDAAPISEILMAAPTVLDAPTAKKLVVRGGVVDLKDVTYRYEPDAEPIFDHLTLHIPAGQRVGVVGRSGGGKTTLTQLLLRFADISGGAIAIDGQDISTVTKASLRQAISYVPQDSHLFHRSIRENIAYAKPQTSVKNIKHAIQKAHISELLQNLPEGLDTKVGERGVKLSGGQRQRVAIARAIVKDAPILIFDEATSALDSESEHYIQASLDELMKSRTSIVIAHRLSTIQKMDRIIVLDNGQIVEDGTHAELVRHKGLYASLWAHQSGGFIDEG
ncbi:MAG: ABC transporter ATP-binding protein [Candidatus Saccharibacteria bacterium]